MRFSITTTDASPNPSRHPNPSHRPNRALCRRKHRDQDARGVANPNLPSRRPTPGHPSRRPKLRQPRLLERRDGTRDSRDWLRRRRCGGPRGDERQQPRRA